jgi:hypothetical protein
LAGHHGIDNTTAATSCRELAVKWLDRCKQHHFACEDGQATFRPTRLLDLASVDVTRKVRLVLSEECKGDEPYVTLSHCWGSTMPFRLTTKTLETMRVGFDLEDLPKTFRDAIEIAGWFQGQSLHFLEASLLTEGSAFPPLTEFFIKYDIYGLIPVASCKTQLTTGCMKPR